MKLDKDYKKVMNELQENFGWSNIDILPESYQDLLNDTIMAVKNLTIQRVNKAEGVSLPTLDALFDKAKHHMTVVCNLQNFEDEDGIMLYSGKYVDGYIAAIKDFVNGEYAPE